MKPSQISESLRKIASGLERNPSPSAVRKELRAVLAAVRAASSEEDEQDEEKKDDDDPDQLNLL